MSFVLEFIANHWKKLALVALFFISTASAFWYGKTKAQVQIVEKEKIVEKIVEKKDENKDQQQAQNTHTETHVIEHPDGTKETVVVADTHTDTKTHEDSHTETTTDRTTETSKTTTPKPPSKYHAGVIASTSVPDLFSSRDKKLEYTATAGMRALGPFWVDGMYNFSQKSVGVGVSIEF